MRTCATCNASHQNTVERVLRCMGCVARPNGNSNWRPEIDDGGNDHRTVKQSLTVQPGRHGMTFPRRSSRNTFSSTT